MLLHTHAHTHRFNGHFLGKSGLERKKERQKENLFMQHSRITHHTINRHDHGMYMASGINFYSQLVISAIRISDISNLITDITNSK